MGLFNRLGREVGKFTKEAKDAAEKAAGYECASCGARFHTDHDSCPECGADAVEPREE